MARKTISLFALFCLCLSSSVWGQSKKSGQESCDGVLDVVPAKALTFTRKRRPAKEASTDSVSVPATSGKAQQASRKKSQKSH